MRIGVLALQGAFKEHCEAFKRLGFEVLEIRKPEQLELIDGLVIPGGESTAIGHLIRTNNFEQVLKNWISEKKPVWGTCAGMILLAERGLGLRKEGQLLLGGLDVQITRNYFGSQIGSFKEKITFPDMKDMKDEDDRRDENKESASSKHPSKPKKRSLDDDDDDGHYFDAVFIRAPAITDLGKDVEVLSRIAHKSESSEAKSDGKEEVIVAVRSGNILATSFHPELTDDDRWHEFFGNIVKKALKKL